MFSRAAIFVVRISVPLVLVAFVASCGGSSDDEIPATYSINGTVTGLSGSITLLTNGGNAVTVPRGSTSFATPALLTENSNYAVTVGTQPAGQICIVSNGSGVVLKTNVVDVHISCSDKIKRAYSIGNSLTWDSQPDGVAALAASQSIDLSVGYHIQPGQPLSFSTTNPHPVDPAILSLQITNSFGTFENALGNNAWHIVTIQPYLSSVNATSTLGSDIAAINLLIDLTKAGPSTNAIFYIYEGWPNTPSWAYPALSIDAYSTTWDALSINSLNTPTALSKQYFDNLYSAVVAEHPQDQVYIIPVGAVLSALDKEISAGHIAGLNSIYDFYRDPTHLTLDVGRFVAAVTVYATYFKTSPVGLSVPPGFYTSNGLSNGLPSRLTNNTALRNQLEQVVWDVVSSDPRTGVTTP